MSENLLLDSMWENIMYLEMQVNVIIGVMRQKGMIDKDVDRVFNETLLNLIKIKSSRIDGLRGTIE